MRIDKYLWCVRYYKTRNIATTACKKGHVRVNNDVVKPGRNIYPMDKIGVRINQINYQLVVKTYQKVELELSLLIFNEQTLLQNQNLNLRNY